MTGGTIDVLADPESVGLDGGRVEALVALAQQSCDAGMDAGIALFVARHGVPVLDTVVGTATDGTPLTTDTRFPFFSATKALTAGAIAVLAERGLLAWNDPLVRHIPEFAEGEGPRDKVTVHHLLTHTAGIPDSQGRGAPPDVWRDWDTAIAATARLPLEYEPGERVEYHGLTYGLLGALVPNLDGRSFADFFDAEVVKPLGLASFTWGPPAEGVPVSGVGVEGQAAAVLAARFTEASARGRVIPAGSGWGAASDLGKFYVAMSQRGGGWLAPATVDRMIRPYATQSTNAGGAGRGYGVVVGIGEASTSVFGELAGPRTFGHPGVRSTVGWCDPDTGVAAAILCNGFAPGPDGQRRLSILSDAVHRTIIR